MRDDGRSVSDEYFASKPIQGEQDILLEIEKRTCIENTHRRRIFEITSTLGIVQDLRRGAYFS